MSQSGDSAVIPRRRRYLREVALEFGKLAICLVLAELALRFAGYDSNPTRGGVHPGIIGDPVVGWRYKPGRYLFSDATTIPPRQFAATYLENGTRDAGGSGRGTPLALFGCSFMDGYGLDDRETIAWKLQEHLPRYDVRNYGVSGYGTYSALLRMREVGRELKGRADAVMLYGFADFHSSRNIKNPTVQKWWENINDGEHIKGGYPICEDTGCSVWRGSPINEWWRRSRLLSLVGNAWDAVLALWQRDVTERVTDRLLVQMKEEAAGRTERLIIAPVTRISARWREFFARNRFEVVECVSSEMSNPEYLQADNHPNDRWATRYADCLARYLQLAKTKASPHES